MIFQLLRGLLGVLWSDPVAELNVSGKNGAVQPQAHYAVEAVNDVEIFP